MLLHCGSCAVTSAGVKHKTVIMTVAILGIIPPSYRSANFTPRVPSRTSPIIHAATPARLAVAITASVSPRAATAIIPTPRLKTRRISPSDTSPARISTRNTGGHGQARASTTASHPAGSTRTRLPGMPPPVMCASACRRGRTGAAAARHARDDRRGGLGLELGGREVVEEREGTGAVRQDVVHTVVHEILPHRVVDPGARGDEHLGADSVGREDQHRALVPGRHSH